MDDQELCLLWKKNPNQINSEFYGHSIKQLLITQLNLWRIFERYANIISRLELFLFKKKKFKK